MDVDEGEGDKCLLCPCCKACKTCTMFQKILNLPDKGLVIYRHPKRVDDQVTAPAEIFILHNTKDIEIKTSDFMPEIEEHEVSCPRCRHILRHAKTLLQSVPTIERRHIIGICDHCRKKAESHRIPCYDCVKIVKKFIDEQAGLIKTHSPIEGAIQSETHGIVINKNTFSPSLVSYENLSWLKKSERTKKQEPELERILKSGQSKRSYAEDVLEPSLDPALKDVPWLTWTQQHKVDKSSRGSKDFSKVTEEPEHYFRTSVSGETLRQKNILLYPPKKSAKPILLKHDKETTIAKKYGTPINVISEDHFKFQKDIIEDTHHHKLFEYVFPRDGNKTKKNILSHKSSEKLIQETHDKLHEKAEKKKKEREELLKKKKEEKEIKRLAEEEKKRISDKSQVLSTSKIRADYASQANIRYDNKKNLRETDKLPSKKDETVNIDRKQFNEKDERKQDKKDETAVDKNRKLIKQKDEMQQDREGKSPKEEDEIKKTKKGKGLTVASELQKEITHTKEKGQTHQDNGQEKRKDESEKNKQEKRKIDVNETQKEKDRQPRKGKDNMTNFEREKMTKETQMQRDEKGKRAKETQTQKSKEIDEKQKEKEVKSAEKVVVGLHGKSTGKKGNFPEKGDPSGTKEEKPEDKFKKEKEKKEKLTLAKQDEESKIDDEKVKQKDQEMLLKVADKVFADALKRKQEQDKAKNKQTDTLKKARELADKAASKHGVDIDPFKLLEMKDFAPIHSNEYESEVDLVRKTVKPQKELNLQQIILQKPSCDDIALMLIKMKKIKDKQKKTKGKLKKDQIFFLPILEWTLLKTHQQKHSVKVAGCRFCDDSDLSLDIGSLASFNRIKQSDEIIRGEKIERNRPQPKKATKEDYPLLFKSTYSSEDHLSVKQISSAETSPPQTVIRKKSQKMPVSSLPDGIIRYALSDRSFIDKGWTLLPTEKVVRKLNMYRMSPAQPKFDWFEHHKGEHMQYDSGETLADFNDRGRGRWFYRNGRVALDYYDTEDVNAQQRYVVYSSGELDDRGHSYPITVLATFDYSGNGVVFDHKGKIRLKYNQTEGVVLDRALGPVSHWKWHSLNDPPQLQQVMIDTHMSHKDPDILKFSNESDPTRLDNYDEDMVAIEFDNFIKEKNKLTSQKFKPFQIKMKALKINNQFSLRILDQATIYLMYRDGATNLKLNLGMLLDNREIVDTDTADVGTVSNILERLPAQTDSIMRMQQKIEYAKQVQRLRVKREGRIRPQMPTASVDQLTAGTSRPLRPVLLTVPSSSRTVIPEQHCKCSRKPLSTNLYYNTRFV